MFGLCVGIQHVILSSTLNEVRTAYSGQMIRFTCNTSGSDTLQWISKEFIGSGDIRLEVYSSGTDVHEQSNIDENAYATRVNAVDDPVAPVIISDLFLRASLQHPIANITCATNNHGKNKTITFHTIREYIIDDVILF